VDLYMHFPIRLDVDSPRVLHPTQLRRWLTRDLNAGLVEAVQFAGHLILPTSSLSIITFGYI
jgi:hypothetical protein